MLSFLGAVRTQQWCRAGPELGHPSSPVIQPARPSETRSKEKSKHTVFKDKSRRHAASLGTGSEWPWGQKHYYLIPKVKVERPQHQENWPRGR